MGRINHGAYVRFQGESCWYCGDPATGVDHVIPHVMQGELTDKVPCCKDCNSRMNDVLLWCKELKAIYLLEKLKKKLNSNSMRLKMTLPEIMECGPNLRGKALETYHTRLSIKSRIGHVARRASLANILTKESRDRSTTSNCDEMGCLLEDIKEKIAERRWDLADNIIQEALTKPRTMWPPSWMDKFRKYKQNP